MSNTTVCVGHQGPPMNTDVSGPGVRISFYLQTILLACLSVRSTSPKEASGAMYTLIATNMAMTATVLILGFKPQPEITLHDGLVVIYLLGLSTTTVYFSLPTRNRSSSFLNYLSIIQNYLFFAFIFALLITVETFGSVPSCNHNAIMVIFGPFPLIHAGQIIAWIVSGVIFIVYSWITIKDHIPTPLRKKIQTAQNIPILIPILKLGNPASAAPDLETSRPAKPQVVPPTTTEYKAPPARDTLNVDWSLLLRIVVVFLCWIVGLTNTELLMRWSDFQGDNDSHSAWQFGQVLPLFLVVVPLVETTVAFQTHGLRPHEARQRPTD